MTAQKGYLCRGLYVESTLGTLYGDYSFLYQVFLMTPNGRIFGAEKNTARFCESGAPWRPTDSNRFISQPPIQLSQLGMTNHLPK